MQVRQLSQNLFLKCSLPGTKWGGHDPLLNGAPQQAEQHPGAGPNPTPTTSMRVLISVKGVGTLSARRLRWTNLQRVLQHKQSVSSPHWQCNNKQSVSSQRGYCRAPALSSSCVGQLCIVFRYNPIGGCNNNNSSFPKSTFTQAV